MTESKHLTIAFLCLIFFGFGSWFFLKTNNPQLFDKKEISTAPDSFMSQLTATRFDEKGNIASKMISTQLTHYPNNNTTVFQNPQITIYRENESPWLITAKHGKAINGTKKITLIDDVHIHQAASKNNTETTITTSKLSYIPKKEFAETDQAITIKQPGTTIKSIGMNAYLKQGKINLLNKARAHYTVHNDEHT